MQQQSKNTKHAKKRFIELIDLRRNLPIGLTIGVLISGFAYFYRINELMGPNLDTRGNPTLFFLLALVLAFCIAILIVFILGIRSLLKSIKTESI